MFFVVVVFFKVCWYNLFLQSFFLPFSTEDIILLLLPFFCEAISLSLGSAWYSVSLKGLISVFSFLMTEATTLVLCLMIWQTISLSVVAWGQWKGGRSVCSDVGAVGNLQVLLAIKGVNGYCGEKKWDTEWNIGTKKKWLESFLHWSGNTTTSHHSLWDACTVCSSDSPIARINVGIVFQQTLLHLYIIM